MNTCDVSHGKLHIASLVYAWAYDDSCDGI